MKKYLLPLLSLFLVFATACSDEDELVHRSTNTQVTEPASDSKYVGFYLLNEGGFNKNATSLDYFNYTSGVYSADIYPEINPEVVKELGDTGNELLIHNNRLYAVINNSHKIEVMEAKTAKRIGQINVEDCRHMVFNGDKAYVSSGGRGKIGHISEVDLNQLKVTRTTMVGKSPEGMLILNNKLYVVNSGGFQYDTGYDNSVSIVDMEKFEEIEKIEVNTNPRKLFSDGNGNIYIISQGDYKEIKPAMQVIDSKHEVVKKYDMSLYINTLVGNELYYLSDENEKVYYNIFDTKTGETISKVSLSEGTNKKIMKPYSIAVDEESKDVYVTDAQDYQGNGYLRCYNAKGEMKWEVITGVLPAHFAFVLK